MLIEQTPSTASHSRTRWILLGACILLAAVAGELFIALRHWPFTKAVLRETLQKHSRGTVQIGSFHSTFFPPRCVAGDVRFLSPEGADKGVPAQIGRLEIQGSFVDILTFRKRIAELRLAGVHLIVPPNGPAGNPNKSIFKSDPGDALVIGRVVIDNAELRFLPRQQGQEPYQIAIQHLQVKDFGPRSASPYEAALTISKPAGAIETKGSFGPLDSGDAGRTHASGSFAYRHANLAVTSNLSGFLDGNGRFDGTLEHLHVTGSTNVPDFHVDGSAHQVGLTTEFDAMVNGTTGDTELKSVQAHLLHTGVQIEGSVAGDPKRPGKTVSVQMAVSAGRIEDLLLLVTEDPKPSMDGAIRLKAHAILPSGPTPFTQKLDLTGDFNIQEAHFTKPATQAPIDRLSKSAAGEKKKQIEEDPRIMLANVRGHVRAENGVARLTNISFAVPGALATMQGTFNLRTKVVDLHGVLDTRGQLSETSSGFKALVLKAITPFYRKKKKLTVIPFHITGPVGHTTVGLDLKK